MPTQITMIAVSITLCALPLCAETRIVFPDDQSVINVRKEFGATGDGKTDARTRCKQRWMPAAEPHCTASDHLPPQRHLPCSENAGR